jgi:hypothetical protein
VDRRARRQRTIQAGRQLVARRCGGGLAEARGTGASAARPRQEEGRHRGAAAAGGPHPGRHRPGRDRHARRDRRARRPHRPARPGTARPSGCTEKPSPEEPRAHRTPPRPRGPSPWQTRWTSRKPWPPQCWRTPTGSSADTETVPGSYREGGHRWRAPAARWAAAQAVPAGQSGAARPGERAGRSADARSGRAARLRVA